VSPAWTVVLVAIGGSLGAVIRHVVELVAARSRGDFPWGTFAVNVVGSFLLGLVVGGASVDPRDSALVLLVGVGLCGALTTYGGFAFQVVALSRDGHGVVRSRGLAAVYVVASVVVAVAAAAAGYALSS
jgi:CrcB protein